MPLKDYFYKYDPLVNHLKNTNLWEEAQDYRPAPEVIESFDLFPLG